LGAFWFEIVVVGVLIGLNGVLSLAEFAVISARKTRLQLMAANNVPGAQTALDLANAPSDFLASVQVGITLISVLTGVFGGAKLAEPLKLALAEISWLEGFATEVSFGIVVVTLSYITLIAGELVPKRVGMSNPENIAKILSKPLKVFSRIVNPVASLLSFSTDLIVGMLGTRNSNEHEVTEEEVTIMVEQGTAAGVFEKAEETIIKRALRLGDKRVGELMIPRPKIIAIDLTDDLQKNLIKMVEGPHSYFPAYEENSDQVVGLISVKSLWAQMARGETSDLKSSLTEPMFVMETVSALKALELFKQSGKHIAIVIDEYGGTAGLITIIDILEAIVGDLSTSAQPVKAAAIKRKDGSWLVDGMMTIDSLKDLFRLKSVPNEKGGDFQTLGGMIMTRMGRIPKETDQFVWEGMRFEVVDMDGMRVDKVLVIPGSAKKPKPEKKTPAAGG
jgi:putative hemolysin